MSGYVNYAPSTKGRVVAICEHCGKRSKPCKPDADGEPEMWGIGFGWSQAPYPRFDAGEALKVRQYPAPTATPSD